MPEPNLNADVWNRSTSAEQQAISREIASLREMAQEANDLAVLQAENAALRTVMIAAAEEIAELRADNAKLQDDYTANLELLSAAHGVLSFKNDRIAALEEACRAAEKIVDSQTLYTPERMDLYNLLRRAGFSVRDE